MRIKGKNSTPAARPERPAPGARSAPEREGEEKRGKGKEKKEGGSLLHLTLPTEPKSK